MPRLNSRRIWEETLGQTADPARARHYYQLMEAAGNGPMVQKASPEQTKIIATIFGASQSLSDTLIAHPDWIKQTLQPEFLQNPRQKSSLVHEVNEWLLPALEKRAYAGAFQQLRIFKNREMLRIAARDLSRLGTALDITAEISNVADVCLQSVYLLCHQQLTSRMGFPYDQENEGPWRETPFAILGLGKLGGQELNYSSDVDLLFVYNAEGFLFKDPPLPKEMTGRGQPSYKFFRQLAETLIAECTKMAPEGTLFRVDMRLRPEGKAGPLARSLGSYENYYAQSGRTWERMMLIKARGVAGDEGVASEFLEMIQPFRYPRSQGEEIAREVAEMKDRIENEVVKAGEMDRNVKLGRGGIREIEFIAQTHQVLYGGQIPFLQGHQTLPTLQNLIKYELMPRDDIEGLTEAYPFLRDVEHRLQMEANRQTHTIPTDRKSRERLAALMGFDELRQFEEALAGHTSFVRSVYQRFFKSSVKPAHDLPPEFDEQTEAWQQILREHSFREPDRAVRFAREFVLGPGIGHVSTRTSDNALLLLSKFFQLCRKLDQPVPEQFLSDPDRVLARLAAFVSGYGARATLYETWRGNGSLFKLLLLVFDRSEFLAEAAIRTPDLIDTLEQSGQLRRTKNRENISQELSHGLDDPDQHFWMRQYHEAELMRIGLRDILGLASSEQAQLELSALAEACIAHALEVVLKNRRLKKPPFAIIGLGRLGGAEMIYGSDSDIIFVASEECKNLPKLCEIAVELLDLLNKRTEHGIVLVADTRLRPDGEKGLLVNSLDAYREYYQKRALLWEIQSLTRARTIAGNPSVGEAFEQMANEFTDFQHPKVQCFEPTWKSQIAKMRHRIETERDTPGRQKFAIKTGKGGLIDCEFIAQALCLQTSHREQNTLKALRKMGALGHLPDAETLALNYTQLLKVELILRRWSLEPESVLPAEPEPLYRVAVRCGYQDAESLLNAVTSFRTAIRRSYVQIFSEEPSQQKK
jgi:glutamate-ammonia-ligase adenylyltransferase